MKKRLCALLMATAMTFALAPAALAEEVATEEVTETAVAEEATPEEAPQIDAIIVEPETEAPVEEVTPVAETEEVVTETLSAEELEEATNKEPNSILVESDLDLSTVEAPSSLTLPNSPITISVGQSLTVTAGVSPYESAADLFWVTSDQRYFTVNAGQNNTASITGVKPTATGEILTVYCKSNPNVKAECRVIVTNGTAKPITDVTFANNETSVTVAPNGKYTITAKLQPEDTTDSKELFWGSNNKDVVTVDAGQNGQCVLTGHNYGTTEVWVKTSNNKYRSVKVTVGIPIDSISLNDVFLSKTRGQTEQLYVNYYPANTGADKTITWTTSDAAVATVNTTGLVTAVEAGKATITATTTNGKTAVCTIQVYADLQKIQGFVVRLYDECLGRSPEASGLQYWVDKLGSGELTGSEAAGGVMFSDEFKAKNYCNSCFIDVLYEAFMDRAPEANGKAYWLGQMANGVTREGVFNGFISSNEFKNICNTYGIKNGNGISVPAVGTTATGNCTRCGAEDGITSFVVRMYKTCLDRTPDAVGMNFWSAPLHAQTLTGRKAAEGFVFSTEFLAHNYNDNDFLEHMYQAFMGRGSDANGKAYWQAKIAAGATRMAVMNGFVDSTEFGKICADAGIKRG